MRCVWFISLFLITWFSWLQSLHGFFPLHPPLEPWDVFGSRGFLLRFPGMRQQGSHTFLRVVLWDRKKSNCFLYTKAFHGETGMGGGLVIRRVFMTSLKTQAPSQNVFISIFIYPRLLSTQQCPFTVQSRTKEMPQNHWVAVKHLLILDFWGVFYNTVHWVKSK